MKVQSLRFVTALAAVMVAVLTLITIQRAYASTTVPNATRMTINIAANSKSAPFTLASLTAPVQVMAATGVAGSAGVCNVTLFYQPKTALSASVIVWSGTQMAYTVDNPGPIGVSAYTRLGEILIANIGYQDSVTLGTHLDALG